MNKLIALNGKNFWATKLQTSALETLCAIQHGGIGSISGYIPTSDWKNPPVVNITMLTAFSTMKLYQRRLAAIQAITLKQLLPFLDRKNPKIPTDDAELYTEFKNRKSSIISSLNQSLSGDRSGAYREGHDRCYATVAQGVVVNFDCEKDATGLQQPKLLQGLPVAEGILFNIIELNRTYVIPGVRKVVNSGCPVLIEKAIDEFLKPKKSLFFKRLALKETNFTELTVSKETITSFDIDTFSL